MQKKKDRRVNNGGHNKAGRKRMFPNCDEEMYNLRVPYSIKEQVVLLAQEEWSRKNG